MSADFEPGHRRPEGADGPEADGSPEDRPERRNPRPGTSGSQEPGAGQLVWLLGGAVAIAAGTALGWDATALSQIVSPAPLVRAALVGGSVALGVVLLLSALARL